LPYTTLFRSWALLGARVVEADAGDRGNVIESDGAADSDGGARRAVRIARRLARARGAVAAAAAAAADEQTRGEQRRELPEPPDHPRILTRPPPRSRPSHPSQWSARYGATVANRTRRGPAPTGCDNRRSERLRRGVRIAPRSIPVAAGGELGSGDSGRITSIGAKC